MKNYRVAALQMTSGSEVTENLLAAKKLIQEAAEAGAKLIVLPEMFALMGVDQTDKIKHREVAGSGPIQDFLSAEAVRHQVWLVGGTIPLAVADDENKVCATCLVFDDRGQCVARYDKIHLFDVQINQTQETYAESKTVKPGRDIVIISTPFGRVGLAVCYDVRFPEIFRSMSDQQVDLIILPAAFTDTTGAAHWDLLVRARAVENQVYMIAAAQTGTHPGKRKTYGHSMIVDPWGEVKACLPSEPGVVVAEIDLDFLQKLREKFPVLKHRIYK